MIQIVPSFTVLRRRISAVLHKIVMLEQRRQQVMRSSERGCTRYGFAVGDVLSYILSLLLYDGCGNLCYSALEHQMKRGFNPAFSVCSGHWLT